MIGRRHFERLVSDLEAGRQPPDAVLLWLINGKRRWEAEPSTSLEKALALIRSRDALRFRDMALREAVSMMPGGWSTSERVRQVQRVARRIEPYLPDPELFDPRNRPGWYVPIFEAMRFGPIPGARRLHDLCSPAGSCKKPVGQCESSDNITAEE